MTQDCQDNNLQLEAHVAGQQPAHVSSKASSMCIRTMLQPPGRRRIVGKTVSSHWHKQILCGKKGCPIQQANCTSPSCKCPVTATTVVQHSEDCCRDDSASPAAISIHSTANICAARCPKGSCITSASTIQVGGGQCSC